MKMEVSLAHHKTAPFVSGIWRTIHAQEFSNSKIQSITHVFISNLTSW